MPAQTGVSRNPSYVTVARINKTKAAMDGETGRSVSSDTAGGRSTHPCPPRVPVGANRANSENNTVKASPRISHVSRP